MSNYESIFKTITIKLKPKDSYMTLRNFYNKYKRCDNFTFLKKSCEVLYNLKQDQYLLQVTDGFSCESCFFNIINDKTGFYIYDNKEIKHFHKKENALKYKLSKYFLSLPRFKYDKSIEYYCFNNNNTKLDKYDYIQNSFENCRRIII